MVEVKALSADQWEIVRQLRLAALRDAPGAFGGSYEEAAQRTEEQWRGWPTGGQTFAAYRDGEPVGIAAAFPAAEQPGVTLLISMWVAPEARGSHAGRLLVEAVAGWARERGGKLLELDVYEHNERAYRAYLKLGFTPVGPCPDHPGAITMHRQIDTPPAA